MLASFSGWKGEVEVVQLEYDPEALSYAQLCARALELGACSIAFPATAEELATAREVFGDQARVSEELVRRVEDTKYYLRSDPLRFVPMSERQATRLNAREQPRAHAEVLSPRQLGQLEFVRAHPDAGWEDLLGVDMLAASKRYERIRERASVATTAEELGRGPR